MDSKNYYFHRITNDKTDKTIEVMSVLAVLLLRKVDFRVYQIAFTWSPTSYR